MMIERILITILIMVMKLMIIRLITIIINMMDISTVLRIIVMMMVMMMKKMRMRMRTKRKLQFYECVLTNIVKVLIIYNLMSKPMKVIVANVEHNLHAFTMKVLEFCLMKTIYSWCSSFSKNLIGKMKVTERTKTEHSFNNSQITRHKKLLAIRQRYAITFTSNLTLR